jgi:DNA mismatch endonuclease (patch repair protein)
MPQVMKANELRPAPRESPSDKRKDEAIFIPQEVRGRTIGSFYLSERLHHVLERRGVAILGDLHGLSQGDFLKTANCGRKTVAELMALVRSVQTGTALSAPIAYEPVRDGLFCVPANAKEINFSELPVSVRLGHVLTRKGFVHLGQLEGLSVRDLQSQRNCGERTISELLELLQQTAGGKFDVPQTCDDSASCRNAIFLIDNAVSKLSARNRQILLWRLGGFGGEPLSLEEVGAKFKVTRERVRQVVERTVPDIRRVSGLKMPFYLRQIAVFVDGCFWHGCSKHCRMPQGNREYWTRKIADNKTRDRFVNRQLRKRGWTVVRIWEHELPQGRRTKYEGQKRVVEKIKKALRGGAGVVETKPGPV